MSASLPTVSVPTLSRTRLAAAPAIVAISITWREVITWGTGSSAGLLIGNARSLARPRCRQ